MKLRFEKEGSYKTSFTGRFAVTSGVCGFSPLQGKWRRSRIWFFLSFLCLVGCQRSSSLDPEQVVLFEKEKNFYPWEWEGVIHQVHYEEKGEGNSHVLFLHGYEGSTFTWLSQMDFLAQEEYHVWALDLLGFGLSDKPLDFPYSIDLFSSLIADFLNEKQIGECHIVGHSVGGGLALYLASQFPDRIRTLSLVAPMAYPMKLPSYLSLARRLGSLALPLMTRNSVHRLLKTVYYNPKEISKEQIDAYWIPLEMPNGKEVALKMLSVFDPQFFASQTSLYSSFELPVLLIWGTEDRWVPSSFLSRFQEDIPHAESILIPFCGHVPQEEASEQVNRALFEFLSGR